MKWIVVFSALVVASCTSTREIVMPDGRSGFLITCDRNFQSIADCRNDARKACGGNYEEVSGKETYLEIVCTG